MESSATKHLSVSRSVLFIFMSNKGLFELRQNNRKVDLLTRREGGGLARSQMSSLGHFMHAEGWMGAEAEGRGFHGNSQVPSCHVWAEIGAVSTGTT